MSVIRASEFDGDPVVQISNKKAAEILKNIYTGPVVIDDFETALAYRRAIELLESMSDDIVEVGRRHVDFDGDVGDQHGVVHEREGFKKEHTDFDGDIFSVVPIDGEELMTGNEYQQLAARTINQGLTFEEQKYHALHGMVGEIGELHSLYQKKYQGHPVDPEHEKKELGDLLWFVAEYCTAKGWQLDDVMQMNIDKLKARYPEGFDPERSKHREAGDV